jgi:hypothetical protein
MAKTTDNRKYLRSEKANLKEKARANLTPQEPSAVEELVELLFVDEPVFAKYVLARADKLAAARKVAHRGAQLDEIRRNLLGGKATSRSRSLDSIKPSTSVRRRLDDVFEKGPRTLSGPEARELLDADPEALAFLRLKLQINASELSAPWVQEVAKRLERRDASRKGRVPRDKP